MALSRGTRTTDAVQARRYPRSGTRSSQRPFGRGDSPSHPALTRSTPSYCGKARDRSYSRTTEPFLSLNPFPLENRFFGALSVLKARAKKYFTSTRSVFIFRG